MDGNSDNTPGKARSTPIGLADFDRATMALDRAAAVINVVSGAYDSEIDAFTPRDGDLWLTMLTALDLVVEARQALAMKN